MYATYTVQKGDGNQDSSDKKYYLKNEIEVHYGGVIYADEVETEIEKDGDAYEIRVPIIKTLYNGSEDIFNGERFYFSVYTDFPDVAHFEWSHELPYIDMSNVAAGSSKTENNSDDAGNVGYSFTMTQEQFNSLPIDEKTKLPYVMIAEYDKKTDKMTYDSNSYKLYLVPEKDNGSPMLLLASVYDPAETHTYYAIADLDAWNKEGSEVDDCAVEFMNYYDKQEVTVTFDANGGTLTGETKTKTGPDGKLASLPTPTRSSYSFDGWYTQEAGGTEVTTDTVFKTDTTVYAHWTYTGGGGGGGGTTRYTLTYESNGGTSYSSTTHAYGTVVKLDKTPTRSGYTFDGWYSDSALKNKITSITMNSNKTVYAGWTKTGSATTPDALNGEDHIAYISGYPDGTVRPEANITRGEVATILYRLLKVNRRDAIFTTSNSFSDVSRDLWYNKNRRTPNP